MLTPIKAIRAKCLDCCCDSRADVKLCVIEKCPLYPYRMGHRPKRYVNPTEDTESIKVAESPYIKQKEALI